MWRDHRHYGYIINCAYFTGVYIINTILHACLWIWILSLRVQLDILNWMLKDKIHIHAWAYNILCITWLVMLEKGIHCSTCDCVVNVYFVLKWLALPGTEQIVVESERWFAEELFLTRTQGDAWRQWTELAGRRKFCKWTTLNCLDKQRTLRTIFPHSRLRGACDSTQSILHHDSQRSEYEELVFYL